VDPLVAHQRAQDAFAAVLAGVTPAQLQDPTPCPDWTVWGVVDHLVGGNWRVAGEARATPTEVVDLIKAHAESASAAQATFGGPDGLTRIYDIRIGSVPGSAFIGLRTTDALVHAWDVAKATGQPTDVDSDVAQAMLEMSRQRISPEFRGAGRPFGEEQACPDERSAADQLAAFLGRET